MPRQARVVAVDVPHHITHRGNNRQDVFLSDEDRRRYQLLLSQHLRACHVDLIGWCWMTIHVHRIAVPRREDSLARLIRRVHSGYAQDLIPRRQMSSLSPVAEGPGEMIAKRTLFPTRENEPSL